MPNFTINPTLRDLQPSATLAVNDRTRQMAEQGQEVFRLGFGQSPFPVPGFLVSALQQHAHEKAYLPAAGLMALREAVCGYLQRTEQLSFSPEQVVIGPGSKELMYLLQSALQSELILPSPSWVSYAPQADILGRKVSWLPGSISASADSVAAELEAHCAANPEGAKLFVLNTPSNPTAYCYSAAQLQAIAVVARRYQLIILSDEIYSGLQFDGGHQSIARYYPEGTIISNGLSKWCGAGGWRLGAFVFPTELAALQRAITALATETFSAVASPIQYAAVEAFEASDEMDDYLLHARRVLKALLNDCYQQLVTSGASLCAPEGGFYLFPTVPPRAGESSQSMCLKLLEETGVAVLPGTPFGRSVDELCMRIACVDFNGSQAMAASRASVADLDQAFLQEHCAATMEGMSRLCAWLSAR